MARAHPFFKTVKGAQTTAAVRRPNFNNNGKDRTLRTVFTHDHFGPSTHQQAGLYAGLVVEPVGSIWIDPETGIQLGTRQDSDGGPTSWQAIIVEKDPSLSHREFLFEFADFQLAYDGKTLDQPAGMSGGRYRAVSGSHFGYGCRYDERQLSQRTRCIANS